MTGLLLALALAAEPAPPAEDVFDHTAVLWNGFDHRWLRRALGVWAMPHRVSEFDSRVVAEHHERVGEELRSTVTVRMAQSTGVDGDYMRPVAWFTRVYAPDVRVYRGTLRFSTVDEVVDLPSPKAFSRLHDLIDIPVQEGVENHVVPLVTGVTFRSWCADDRAACNSDGIWPYRFLVELSPCHPHGEATVCPAMVEVGRAWTPNLGGLPGFEVKPLNQRMGFDVELHYAVLVGPKTSIASRTVIFENALASTRRTVKAEQVVTGRIPGASAFHAAAVGFSSFGFQFFPTGRRQKLQHRGRYLHGWGMWVRPVEFDPAAGTLSLGHGGGIGLPRTVKTTGVSYELGITTVLFTHPEARMDLLPGVDGQLCANSRDAPFFSTWNGCGRRSPDGQEHRESMVTVNFP